MPSTFLHVSTCVTCLVTVIEFLKSREKPINSEWEPVSLSDKDSEYPLLCEHVRAHALPRKASSSWIQNRPKSTTLASEGVLMQVKDF